MRSWEIIIVVFAAAIVVSGVVALAREFPPMRRYMRIKRM